MPTKTTKTADPARMDLAALEELHEDCNVRRGELAERRQALVKRADVGEPVHRDIRQVDRDLAALQDEVDDYQPHLEDARARAGARERRASQLDVLEQNIDVWADVLAFQDGLEKLVTKHLVPHLPANLVSIGGERIPERYARIARDVLVGPLHLNGSPMTTPGQVRERLRQAKVQIDRIRAEEAADGR